MTTNYMQGLLREYHTYKNSLSPRILGTLRQEGHRPSKKKVHSTFKRTEQLISKIGKTLLIKTVNGWVLKDKKGFSMWSQQGKERTNLNELYLLGALLYIPLLKKAQAIQPPSIS